MLFEQHGQRLAVAAAERRDPIIRVGRYLVHDGPLSLIRAGRKAGPKNEKWDRRALSGALGHV